MEIALINPKALRIKGKQTIVLVNPQDLATPHQAALYFQKTLTKSADAISIIGPGEYEVGGIKISGIKSKEGTVYSLSVDDIDILVGDLAVITKLQHKLKEHNIVVLQSDSDSDASFANGLATNAVMVYGEKAKEVVEKFAKEGTQQLAKFQSTKDKLPQEVQTILLA